MHDIDSTRLETSPDYNEREDQQEFESQNGQGEESFEMPMTEGEEEALAAELLSVASEYEMDQFLGGLFGKLKRRLGGAAKFLSQNSGPLAAALKGIGAKALPFLSGALGAAIPIPGVGAAFNTVASNLLQSEMENLEVEEQEFEMARRYVRFASQALRQAARIPARANPSAAVNFALRNAFRSLRGSGGFRPQPIYVRYRPCAPCPPPEPCATCPTCAQALPTADLSDNDSGQGSTSAEPASNASAGATASAGAGAAASGEFEFEEPGEFQDAGEFEPSGEFENTGESDNAGQGEGDNYENDNEATFAQAPDSGRSGRWVRRGRKIVLYGL